MGKDKYGNRIVVASEPLVFDLWTFEEDSVLGSVYHMLGLLDMFEYFASKDIAQLDSAIVNAERAMAVFPPNWVTAGGPASARAGMTPLGWACLKGHLQLSQLLLKADGVPDETIQSAVVNVLPFLPGQESKWGESLERPKKR